MGSLPPHDSGFILPPSYDHPNPSMLARAGLRRNEMRRVRVARAGRCVLVFQGGGAPESFQAGTLKAAEAQ